jgi:hypothetical protein
VRAQLVHSIGNAAIPVLEHWGPTFLCWDFSPCGSKAEGKKPSSLAWTGGPGAALEGPGTTDLSLVGAEWVSVRIAVGTAASRVVYHRLGRLRDPVARVEFQKHEDANRADLRPRITLVEFLK